MSGRYIYSVYTVHCFHSYHVSECYQHIYPCSFIFLKRNGSCVVFLVHDTILQQWTSLLKNSAIIGKKPLCPWLLNNRASDCWAITPVTIEQSCQCLLNNGANNCWTIVPATIEESCQWMLNNCTTNCWRIVSATSGKLCQPLLN